MQKQQAIRTVHDPISQNRRAGGTPPANEGPAFNADMLFNLSPQPMWIYATDSFRFLKVNTAAVRNYGWTETEFLQMTVLDIRPADEVARFKEHPVSTARTTHHKIVHRDKGGKLLLADVHVQPIRYAQKAAMMVVVENITQSLHQELHIEQLQQEMKEIQDAICSAAIVSVTDARGLITYVNDNFERVSGYRAAEIIGRPHTYMSADHHDRFFWEGLWRFISEGKIWQGDVKNRAKNGSTFWTHTHIVPMKNEDGTIRCFYCIRTLNTDQKEAEEKILAAKNKLEAFFNSSAEACVLLNPSFHVVAFNSAAHNIVQLLYDKQIEEDTLFTSYCSEDFQQLIYHAMPQVLRGNSVLNVEMQKNYVIKEKNIAVTWNLKFLPARDSRGKIIGMAVSIEDISAYKQFEATIIEQNKRLRDIAWKNSHLLRAPLCNIKSLLQLSVNEPEQRSDLMSMAQAEAEKLDRIIFDISDVIAEPLPAHPSISSDQIMQTE